MWVKRVKGSKRRRNGVAYALRSFRPYAIPSKKRYRRKSKHKEKPSEQPEHSTIERD